MPHLGVLRAAAPVCDHCRTAGQDLNRRELEPLILLAGISAGVYSTCRTADHYLLLSLVWRGNVWTVNSENDEFRFLCR